ncbi:RluA family pseudouridine synthase [Zhaonella formicivorans]|uniref:RluA family pseudouridine synthase n=1 Tax=Zhaonella formicivorans TaxID=2528593 RepID=UPI0010D6F0C8|nr:RluA family pseudouridine synthase [Zhaonella formicivorans]
MEVVNFLITAEDSGKRLDRYLTEQLPELSRSRIQELIGAGQVQVNHQAVKANYKLKKDDAVTVVIPAPEPLEVLPEAIPLDILYEDGDLLVVNKPQGMVVHPAAGNYSGTLVNALLYHCRDLSGINGILRPGIVHRIDKDTSGVLVVAKNDAAHRHLAKQIKEHSVTRTYLALVHGTIKEQSGRIEAPIGRDPRERKRMAVVDKNGKEAVTSYTVLERFVDYTYLQLRLKTGRTHQIRVHMAYLGHPVVGDPKYGPQKPHFGLEGQALHASTLGFVHPRTGAYLEFTAPLPQYFADLLEKLRKTRKKEA